MGATNGRAPQMSITHSQLANYKCFEKGQFNNNNKNKQHYMQVKFVT